ncbi:hypothetical protein AURDEDRAFT_182460 [Auricularia subglabra TFB-10046 SS5]|nr:hypothetical protein AURDEDRAFT_182460 [Auricularia subglabra TFB-10046 SS5]
MSELPCELREQLQKTMSAFFDQAWDVLGPGAKSITDVEDIVSGTACEAVAAAACKKYESIAQTARLRNDSASWLNRLPNELWYRVWELLPFRDRFSATHVCARWRAAMRALPRLWTNLHLYTYSLSALSTPGPSSEAVPGILALSQDLTLDVTVEGSDDPFDLVADIATALRPHVSRIVRLCVRSPYADAPSDLLRLFEVLPALREFVADRPTVIDTRYPSTRPFWPRGVELPVLECARLALGVTWPKDERRLPSMRVLELTPRDNATEELCAALTGCPQLTSLKLDLRGPDSAFRAPYDRSGCKLKERLSVTAVSVRDGNLGWAISSFDGSILRERVLEFDACDGVPTLYRGLMFSELGWASFTDTVDIRMTYNAEKTLSIRAVASDGRIRAVSSKLCSDPTPEIDFCLKCLSQTSTGRKVKVTADASLRDSLSRLPSTFAGVELYTEYVKLP